MQELTKEQKDKIIQVLTEMNAVQGCPRCGNDSFVLLDFFMNKPNKRLIGVPEEPIIPSIFVVCDKCGYISQHAIDILKDRIGNI
ncbi:MAG: hypothetical protein ACOC6L_03455 [Thermodesulfobacteriota bacterium]